VGVAQTICVILQLKREIANCCMGLLSLTISSSTRQIISVLVMTVGKRIMVARFSCQYVACETAEAPKDGYDVRQYDVYCSSRVSRHYLSYISHTYLSQ
jgi:hypothetical protein